MPRKDRSFFLSIAFLVLFLNILPFALAVRAGGDQFVFDGVLLNPIDGHTYLAKMYQGYRGDWRFTLPYTADSGQGAYMNLFYLLLGHLARFTGLSFPLVFSLARILAGLLLLISLFRFFENTLSETRPRRVAFTLAAFGSGIGWMLIPAGTFTADFWVAETYPFLSIYDNPHFPLGLAIILWLLTPTPARSEIAPHAAWGGLIAIAALALSAVSPFGVVVVIVVMAGALIMAGLENLRQRSWQAFFAQPLFSCLLWTVVSGAPMLIYQFWIIRTDPVLSGWDAQNLTPTPPWWDVLVSLSPALLLSLAGWRQAKIDSPSFLLVIWAVLGLLLIVIPFGLQRRFMMGLYVPLAGLAALGIESLTGGKRRRARTLIVALFLLALPTNLVVILAGQAGVQSHDPFLYRTVAEARALDWLAAETPVDSIVLASPEMGLLIPAFSGRQVVYGHPFETVNAEAERQAIFDFFQTMTEFQAHDFVTERGVDYIFVGSREHAVGDLPFTDGLELVFETGEVQIYIVEK